MQQRQFDKTNCSIFVYKDLKNILKDPTLIDQMKKNVGSLISIKEKSTANFFEEFPTNMLKMIQTLSKFLSSPKALEITDKGCSLKDYILEGKIGYNEASPKTKDTYSGEQVFRNKIAEYFRQKYLQKIFPKMLEAIELDQVTSILNQYDFKEYISGQITDIDENIL